MPYSKTLRALRNFGDTWTMIITSVVHVALAAILIVAVLPLSAAINIHHWISSATRKQKEQDIWDDYYRRRAGFIADFEKNRPADSTYPLDVALKGFDIVNKPFYS
jgi:hypothetical protein